MSSMSTVFRPRQEEACLGPGCWEARPDCVGWSCPSLGVCTFPSRPCSGDWDPEFPALVTPSLLLEPLWASGGGIHPVQTTPVVWAPHVQSVCAIESVSAELSLGSPSYSFLPTGSVVMSLIIPTIGHLCGPFLLLFFVVLLEICQFYWSFKKHTCFLIDYLCHFSVLNSNYFFFYIFIHALIPFFVCAHVWPFD